MALMGPEVRIPRFQRTKRELVNTTRIEFTPLPPSLAAKCADNLCLLHSILISDRQGDTCLNNYRVNPPQGKLCLPQPDPRTRRLFHDVFSKTGYDPGTGSMSMYFLYLYLCENPNDHNPPANLVAAALIVANKVFDDTCLRIRTWSSICQIPSSRLAEAELALLNGIKWKLSVSKDEYYWWGKVIYGLMQRVSP